MNSRSLNYFGVDKRLGLGAHFGGGPEGDAVFAMVANRLCDPRSKRAAVEWAAADVVVPSGFSHPGVHRYYRALDSVAESKEATESHLYGRVCDLANLDLRLICYDLTSTYFETSATSPSTLTRMRGYAIGCVVSPSATPRWPSSSSTRFSRPKS